MSQAMADIRLILYSKPGCHLCEGLQEKLEQIQKFDLELEVRDITTREDWFQAYRYEIPVLFLERNRESGVGSRESEVGNREVEEDAGTRGRGDAERNLTTNNEQRTTDPTENSELKTQNSSLTPIPRPSPRASVQQLEQMLQKYL